MLILITVAAGYLLGSIPFGLVLTKLAGTEDIRSIGSGNIGATNVLRTGRKGLAAGTLLLDALKGTAAVLLGRWIGGESAAILGGLAAFAGHVYPVWLGFKGGKGAATYIGALLGFHWPLFLLFAGAWLATAFLTRFSSAASLTASAL
ncbi:MAG TPA: glycerol-3-phosphate acyltransferase, partial [Hyphomonas sp.]|nr:glycerol-3-phosphate acyltransferase [Hyphomonas sp.]